MAEKPAVVAGSAAGHRYDATSITVLLVLSFMSAHSSG